MRLGELSTWLVLEIKEMNPYPWWRNLLKSIRLEECEAYGKIAKSRFSARQVVRARVA
jgi:hypothetical protein